jgi:hypothetical protein
LQYNEHYSKEILLSYLRTGGPNHANLTSYSAWDLNLGWFIQLKLSIKWRSFNIIMNRRRILSLTIRIMKFTKYYLKIQFLHQRKHNASSLKRSIR